MSGILFMKTTDLNKVREFYINQVEAELWLEQEDCVILRHGNFLFGFCRRDETDKSGLLTFFFDSRAEVDRYYVKLKSTAKKPPVKNEKYNIYHFYAADPEGRQIEFQYFYNRVDPYRSGDGLLLSRRSIRYFKDIPVTDEVLGSILEICRFAPTSMNTQSYYFKIIRDESIKSRLAGVRGDSSSPIGRAPLAVAICADPAVSRRHIQDGCIAAYHFLLAAWQFGLGTCWIAAMDRDEVKKVLRIPDDHYVATVTPLGYPVKWPVKIPSRKSWPEYIKE